MKRIELSLFGASLILSFISLWAPPEAQFIAGACVGTTGGMVWDSLRRGYYQILPRRKP